MNAVTQLSLNISRPHKTAIRALAQLEGETMSVIIRRLIRQEAQARNVWLSAGDDFEEDRDAIANTES